MTAHDLGMRDDYKPLDHAPYKLSPCPVCGSPASLWQYTTSPTTPRKLVVMCTHGDKIGPQDSLIREGCLLYMPGDDFYRDMIRSAVKFWNEFADALTALRNRTIPG